MWIIYGFFINYDIEINNDILIFIFDNFAIWVCIVILDWLVPINVILLIGWMIHWILLVGMVVGVMGVSEKCEKILR